MTIKEKQIHVLTQISGFLQHAHFNNELNGDILTIDDGFTATLSFQKKVLTLSFNVVADNTYTAILASKLHWFFNTFVDPKDFSIDIYEPYVYVFDDEGEYDKMLFGDEARDYISVGGEESIESRDKVDTQQKMDSLLDKINSSGLKSLTKDEKDFLSNFSKGKKRNG